jgi:glycosyltransferase involved in cell wall biosynthesis
MPPQISSIRGDAAGIDGAGMEKPWLSVITPCRNGQRWLAAALQSIVDQREPGIEVVFVDASTDNASLDIVDSFSDRLNIRTFHRTDLSYMAGTNFGVEQASGEHICILHVDDLWLPDRCVQLRNWLCARPNAVMHLHSCYIIDEAGKRLGLWRCPFPNGDTPIPTCTYYERLLVQNFISTPTITIRRDAYLKVAGLDDSLWHTADWDFYMKIASVGEIWYHPNPLACYRVHSNSLTVLGSKDSADYRNQFRIVVDRYAEKLSAESKKQVLRIAEASIEVNVALAAVLVGDFSHIIKAFVSILALGPRGICQYLYYSRIVDRLIPRVRALVAGRL